MLRLSKKADYALIAMKHLARQDGEASASAREIAGQYDIPHELMAKVLQRLARRGLLDSTQGTHGGYTLGRPAQAISVADVIEAIDGPFTVTACSTDDSGGCDQFAKCSIKDPLWQIRERIVQALGTVTMAEMAEDKPGSAPVGVHPAVMRRGGPEGRDVTSRAEGHER
jgi:Rrf2 family protein